LRSIDHHHVLRGQHLAARAAEQHVADLRHFFTIRLAEANDDRVFVAGIAEHRGLCAGDVGANGVGHAGHGQAEQCRLVAIDAHRELGTALLLLQAGVGDAGGGIEQRLEILRDLRRGRQVVAENLDRQPAVAAAAAHAAHHVLLAA
jgi:hypothetical protein